MAKTRVMKQPLRTYMMTKGKPNWSRLLWNFGTTIAKLVLCSLGSFTHKAIKNPSSYPRRWFQWYIAWKRAIQLCPLFSFPRPFYLYMAWKRISFTRIIISLIRRLETWIQIITKEKTWVFFPILTLHFETMGKKNLFIRFWKFIKLTEK
jgi:hypothetical protein